MPPIHLHKSVVAHCFHRKYSLFGGCDPRNSRQNADPTRSVSPASVVQKGLFFSSYLFYLANLRKSLLSSKLFCEKACGLLGSILYQHGLHTISTWAPYTIDMCSIRYPHPFHSLERCVSPKETECFSYGNNVFLLEKHMRNITKCEGYSLKTLKRGCFCRQPRFVIIIIRCDYLLKNLNFVRVCSRSAKQVYLLCAYLFTNLRPFWITIPL